MSDSWMVLRQVTPARIALGHVGASLPTSAHLEFQLAHARARDAVAHELDVAALTSSLFSHGISAAHVRTEAVDRIRYLADPGSGSRLDPESRMEIEGLACDVAFVIADGLSAAAVERHAPEVLRRVGATDAIIVSQGRVAIGDEIGHAAGARLAVVLIGERPGLTAPDSMGIYITWQPRAGRTNAERNCISNVRPAGLSYDVAAMKLQWLMAEALRRGLTGVSLKEEA